MIWLRTVLYFSLLGVGFITWGLGALFFGLTVRINSFGYRFTPDHARGNCWTYAMHRFHTKGGYLLIREAGGQALFGRIKIPHVIWVRKLPSGHDDLVLEQFVPVNRKVSKWLPWYTVYFEGEVKTHEIPRNAKE